MHKEHREAPEVVEQYETPKSETHNPLEIMSKYADYSSDLPGI